jgi:hypothetical protein
MDKIRKILNTHYRQTSIVMMALAGIFFLDMVYQIQMHVRWRLWMPNTLVADNPATKPAPPPLSRPPELHASIRKRNIFMEPQPRGHGACLTGVMGTFALFSGRGGPFSLEEGKSANGITLKAIKDYEVTIEYKGKTEVMKLFGGASVCGPSGPNGPGPVMPAVRGSLPNQPTPPGMSERLHRRVRMMKERNMSIDLNRNTKPCTTAP